MTIDIRKIKAGDKVIVACGNTELTVEKIKDLYNGGITIWYAEGFEGNYHESMTYELSPVRIIEHIPQVLPFDWADVKPGMCFTHKAGYTVWYIGGEDYADGSRIVCTIDKFLFDSADLHVCLKDYLTRHPEGDIK